MLLVNQDGARAGPVRAKVTQRIRGDCVYLVHGWGQTAKRLRYAYGRGASDSALVTRYAVDPIMGGTGMNVNFVRLERAGRASMTEALRDGGGHACAASAATPASSPARRRTRCPSGGFRDWIVQEVTRGTFPDALHGDPLGALQPVQPPVLRRRLPDRRERTSRRAASWA